LFVRDNIPQDAEVIQCPSWFWFHLL